MTVAEESVRAGKLNEALVELQGHVKKQPADPRARVFLFQLLAVMGQWERAATQLEVAGELDASTLEMVRTYREVLRCEQLRARVFAGRTMPLIFGEPAPWVAPLLQALTLTATGRFAEAQALRAEAFERAPATPGRIDDQPFAWIADADSRLGPMLEAIVNGRYYWIPFSRVRELTFEKPVDLRDLAWTPALLTLANGGETVAFIPTRYPGSEKATDMTLVMSRATTWIEQAGETFLGLGQRVLTTDVGDRSLMDVRCIRLDPRDE
jgi:type VI secretion system protein ImpE